MAGTINNKNAEKWTEEKTIELAEKDSILVLTWSGKANIPAASDLSFAISLGSVIVPFCIILIISLYLSTIPVNSSPMLRAGFFAFSLAKLSVT